MYAVETRCGDGCDERIRCLLGLMAHTVSDAGGGNITKWLKYAGEWPTSDSAGGAQERGR